MTSSVPVPGEASASLLDMLVAAASESVQTDYASQDTPQDVPQDASQNTPQNTPETFSPPRDANGLADKQDLILHTWENIGDTLLKQLHCLYQRIRKKRQVIFSIEDCELYSFVISANLQYTGQLRLQTGQHQEEIFAHRNRIQALQDELAEAKRAIASQLNTIKMQDAILKRQVDSAINAENGGQGKKRKRAGERAGESDSDT